MHRKFVSRREPLHSHGRSSRSHDREPRALPLAAQWARRTAKGPRMAAASGTRATLRSSNRRSNFNKLQMALRFQT